MSTRPRTAAGPRRTAGTGRRHPVHSVRRGRRPPVRARAGPTHRRVASCRCRAHPPRARPAEHHPSLASNCSRDGRARAGVPRAPRWLVQTMERLPERCSETPRSNEARGSPTSIPRWSTGTRAPVARGREADAARDRRARGRQEGSHARARHSRSSARPGPRAPPRRRARHDSPPTRSSRRLASRRSRCAGPSGPARARASSTLRPSAAVARRPRRRWLPARWRTPHATRRPSS